MKKPIRRTFTREQLIADLRNVASKLPTGQTLAQKYVSGRSLDKPNHNHFVAEFGSWNLAKIAAGLSVQASSNPVLKAAGEQIIRDKANAIKAGQRKAVREIPSNELHVETVKTDTLSEVMQSSMSAEIRAKVARAHAKRLAATEA